ncbi:BTAD domain-containing putative transcriptional regulator [Dactylosporangium sp. NPDC051485]|uniref:AfsR/SARP family transcriptional regulator n=1 Tax=Dactylosporangium sp. NPDC051485 TaxID=3154846 RepID=UPI003424228A
MLFRSLGPLSVIDGDQSQQIGTPRARAVLGLLLVRRGGLVGVDQLVDEIWAEQAPGDVRPLVHGYVSRVRRALGPAAARLVTHKPGYRLEVGAEEWDVARFEGAVARARAVHADGAVDDAVAGFAEALALWTGEPFADVPATPAIAAATTALTELRLAAVDEWFAARLDAGVDPHLVADLARYHAEHPHRERLAGQLMLALQRSGRRADALGVFRDVRRRLVDDLGVEPGPELQLLHRHALEAGPAAAPSRSSSLSPSPARSRVPAQLPLGAAGFVGREAELAALDRARELVVVTGTAGVGKSALAVHWAREVQDRYPDGRLFADLRGFAPDLAVDPADALLRFLVALGVPEDRVPHGVEARAAQYRSVLHGRRVLVVLDNARDVEQVRPLLPGSAGCLAVVTSRDRLTGLVAVEGAHAVALDALGEPEAAGLLAARLGADRVARHRDAVARIVRRCAGLPLALAVVAATSAVQPGLSLDAIAADVDRGSLDAFGSNDPRADLRSVFSWSYATLSPGAAELFALLGLHPGPDVSVAAAASLAGCDLPEAQRLLLELAAAQLLGQHGPGRFAAHDLLRAYAAELVAGLGPEVKAAQARLLGHYLHTAHAAALHLDPNRAPIPMPALPDGVTGPEPADPDEALAWFAAEHGTLVALVPAAGWRLAWAMSTYLRRGGHGRTWIAVAEAAARAATEPVGIANAAFQVAMAHFRYGDPAEVGPALAIAERQFRALDDAYGLAGTSQLQGLRHEREGDLEAAYDCAERSLVFYQRAGHLAGQGRALAAMAWYQARQGNLRPGLEQARAALVLAEASQDRTSAANLWDSIGFIHLRLDELVPAETAYRRSIALYRELSDRYNVVEPLFGLGNTHRARGDTQRALAAWREGFALAAELHHPALSRLWSRLAPAGYVAF